MATVGCPACGGPGKYMGTLGCADWFRCQNCGWEWHPFPACVDPVEDAIINDEDLDYDIDA
jgi:hypothetical protein